MVKFVFDSDGLIKMARTGILENATGFGCFITAQVFSEVMNGKEKMYEDAFIVEDLVSRKKIAVVDVKTDLPVRGLGEGELSALSLFNKIKADAIISDDRKFIALLGEQNVPLVLPTDFVVFLFKKKSITKDEAIHALERIKALVSEENYSAAKENLTAR